MRILLFFVFMLLISGCGLDQNRLNHVVLIWFNDDVTAAEIETVKAKSHALKAIGELKYIQSGNAIESSRGIVDDSFDLGILIQFDSKEAMERYVNDPRHKAFVEEHINGRVKKLLVYDF